MKRTRRAALATMLGSSVFLGAETSGTTRGRLEREISIETVTDAEASLGLTDGDGPGGETVLFERPTGHPPATFDLLNQLAVPIDVELALTGELRFDAVETAPRRVDLTDDALLADRLAPGETIEAITLDLDCRGRPPALYGDHVTGTLTVEADGADVAIEAERSLELTSDVLLTVDLCDLRALPDVIVAVRKRHGGRQRPTLVVETIDCASGDSSVVDRLQRWEARPFDLSLPSLGSASRQDLSIDASSNVDVAIRDGRASPSQQTAAADGSMAANAGDAIRSDEREQEDEDQTLIAVDPTGGSGRSANVIDVPLED